MPQGITVKRSKKSKSVLRNIRHAKRREAVNRMNRTRIRTAIRRMRAALVSGDAAAAAQLVPDTYSAIDKAVCKGVLAKNTANRYKSRLVLALNATQAKK